MTHPPLAPLALTMGEPAGVGPELTLKAWLRRDEGLPLFFALGDPEHLRETASVLGLDLAVEVSETPASAVQVFERALPVLPISLASLPRPGCPDPANAPAVRESIERACALTQSGAAAGMVTNPIQKDVMYAAGFAHPGHTEFLAELAGGGTTPVMMLACEGLRVIPVTIHLPLARVAESLTSEAIVTCGRIANAALRADFGLDRPRLAVAALNPHAGEGGTLGREEIEIIAPAVARLAAEGVAVAGPAPADTLFHDRARRSYDAVLCMYHDQALIPLKTIDFDHGVNITLGLPFVRTSPDHGTALDIAGAGRADPASLMAALRLAAAMAKTRQRARPA